MKISIGIVDSHPLFLKSLAMMINSFKDFNVTVLISCPEELPGKIRPPILPDIMLIDINGFPDDGITSAKWVNQNYPTIKLAALSFSNNEQIIINMIKAGCCAFMLMTYQPEELEHGLKQIYLKGFFNSDAISTNYRRLLLAENEMFSISEKEKTFLGHACTDLTYKEIATAMNLSERTIDGYREALFHKFKVQSRVGLAVAAIRKDLVRL
ncbi:MAG TPA: response regulator transcription factor [Hanamia sp.]|nr:response regulator transcription factor [Hanamia sp.]